jgi:hypothetical protein
MAYSGHLPRRLRVGSERRHEDGEGQRRNEPNGIEPHGDLLLTRIAPDLVQPNKLLSDKYVVISNIA